MEHKKLIIGVLVILLVAGVAGVSASTLNASSALDHGLQEFAQGVPVWQQVNSNGFGDPQAGEVSALEAFNGYLYAGTFNPINPAPGQLYDGAQIFRSSDGVNWNPVTNPGFGNTHDTAPPAILDFTVFKGYLFASTGGGNAAQIWRSVDGVNWGRVVNAGFGDPDIVDLTVMAEYGGWLYVGARKQDNEAQIWRTFTGDGNLSNWEQVAVGADPARVTGLAVFDGDGGLYAAVQPEDGAPAKIWRSYGGSLGSWETVVSDGFGDVNTSYTGGMAVFGGYLYVGAGNTVVGAQLWRSNDGANWAQVITPGFGDANNQKAEMVYVFHNQLYVSVKNTATGMELWRSVDGASWEQANADGFGDSNNSGSNWRNATAEFPSQLYVGTSNVVDGGELWRMQQPLMITKTVQTAHTPVLLGDPITYTVVIANSGSVDATGVHVTDTLPVGVTGVDLDWTGTVTGSSQVAFTLPALVTTDVAFYGQTVANTAYYVHTTGSGSGSASFTIASALGPDLSGSGKTSDAPGQQVAPGALVTFTITLANGGATDASVAVTDALESHYTVYAAGDFSEAPAGTLVWNGSVPAGQQVTLHFVAQVVNMADLPIDTTVLSNTLWVSDGTNPVFSVPDVAPPFVEIHGVYLPLIVRDAPDN